MPRVKTLHAGALTLMLAIPLNVFAATYEIDVKVTNSQAYTSLDLRVAYAAAPGGFVGSEGLVVCSTTVNALAAFADNENVEQLDIAFASTTPIQGPKVVATCDFSSTGGAPTAGQFVLTVRQWSASHSTPPTIAISRIALK